MELVYYTECSFDDGIIQGILVGCDSQQYSQVNTINLLEEIHIEHSQSSNINIELSTESALIERASMIENDQRVMQGIIHQNEWKIEQWDNIIQRIKNEKQDFSEPNWRDYDDYLNKRQQIIRNEQRASFWEATSDFDKSMMLSLEIREELLNRKLNNLINKGLEIQKDFANQADQLLQLYQNKVMTIPFTGIDTRSMDHMINLLEWEFKDKLHNLRQDEIKRRNEINQFFNTITDEIRKIKKQIEYFDEEATEDFDNLMGIEAELLILKGEVIINDSDTDTEYPESDTELL